MALSERFSESKPHPYSNPRLLIGLVLGLLAGCATVPPKPSAVPEDDFEELQRQVDDIFKDEKVAPEDDFMILEEPVTPPDSYETFFELPPVGQCENEENCA